MKKSLIIFYSSSVLLIALSVVYYNAFSPFSRSAKEQGVGREEKVTEKGAAAKQEAQSGIFNFVSDYIKSLSYFKTAQAKVEDVQNNAKNYKDDIEMGADFMKSFKLANKDLSAASSLLEKHKDYDNQHIQKAVKMAEMSYNRLMQLNDTSADILTKMMDKQGHFNLGKYMREMGTISSEKNGLLQALMYTSTLISHALVDENPDETGNLTYLVLASKKRQELVNLIDKTFGEGAKQFKAGAVYSDAPAAALRHILAGEHHSADER